MIYAPLSILIAYLIGSISSAYVVGRVSGAIDMRVQPDGRVSAAAIYRRLGPLAWLIVVVMDICLAIIAVTVARILTGSPAVIMLAGLATAIGHNWSPFLKFKGGLGATTICGVMGTVAFVPFIYGLGIAGIVVILTFKPGLSSGIGIASMSGFYFIQNGFAVLGLLPLALLGLMLTKRAMLGRAARATAGPPLVIPEDDEDAVRNELD